MATVLLVCVAGVSGTFLAKRMRQLDPTLDTVVSAFEGVARVIDGADVVLIAPQLVDARRAIAHLAPGVPAALLPAGAFAAGGAEIAVSTVHGLLGGHPAPVLVADPTPASAPAVATAYPGASA